MKKLCLLFLIVSLGLSIGACSKQDSGSSEPNENVQTE